MRRRASAHGPSKCSGCPRPQRRHVLPLAVRVDGRRARIRWRAVTSDVRRIHQQRLVPVRPDAVPVAVLAVVHREILVADHRVDDLARLARQRGHGCRDRVLVLARDERHRHAEHLAQQRPPDPAADDRAWRRDRRRGRSGPRGAGPPGRRSRSPPSRERACTRRPSVAPRSSAVTARNGLPIPSTGTWYAPRNCDGSSSGTSSRVSSGEMSRAPGTPQLWATPSLRWWSAQRSGVRASSIVPTG